MTEKTKEHVFDEAAIAAHLRASLPHWTCRGGHLCRIYKTGGWKATLMVVTTIGHLAEAAWHHPDLLVSYASVEVRLQNHSAGGITAKDFALAAKIEDVVQWQPAREGQGLEGTPQGDERFAYIKYDPA